MPRKKVLEGGTRDEIISAALGQFMHNGYENTSVKMILTDANAAVGSFYHYFKSKEELFEEAVKLYLKGYESRIAQIVSDEEKSAMELIDLVLDELERSVEGYRDNLQGHKLHWTVSYTLHKLSLQALLPSVQRIVEKALEEGTATNVLELDIATLSMLVLQGVEGIIHVRPIEELTPAQMKKVREDALAFLRLILNLH